MSTAAVDPLARLGAGESRAQVRRAMNWTEAEFDAWWNAECRRRVPPDTGEQAVAGLKGSVTIRRDALGIPHVEATSWSDLMFGHGYAVAADRLFQIDWIRRRAAGRLAERIGSEGVASDRLARTLNLPAIAQAEWSAAPPDTRAALEAFAAGVTALIEATADAPPIEFDLLGDRPGPWTPIDSLLILGDFRWYLTGRFPVICIPELAKRALGEGPLYQAFLLGEADDESIIPPGSYPSTPQAPLGSQSSGLEGPGSNNWALATPRSTTGKPIIASDPHVPFYAVSIWHDVVLHGDGVHAAGIALAGTPGLMIGRTKRLAWGITNNICSLRDLYQERTDPAHPGCFEYNGAWEPAHEREEIIPVRNADAVRLTVRSSRHGPVVDDLLPPAAQGTGPVTLRWAGREPCGWATSLIRGLTANSIEEFRATLEPWCVPTFNLVFADADGHIGHQATGRIPIRNRPERGYRRGWDPADEWTGFVPFEALQQTDPPRGYIVTANNRLAPDDFPYPLSGTWSSGHRARVIRETIERSGRMSPVDCQQLQMNTRSGRAVDCLPHLLRHLADMVDGPPGVAVELLRVWDGRSEPDLVAPSLFHVWFGHWSRTVAAERFPIEQATFVAANAGGLAAQLLIDDPHGWFHQSERVAAIRQAFLSTLRDLTRRLGPNPADWLWGRLHILNKKHPLSDRGDLGVLLDRSGHPVRGDGTTVHSSTSDPDQAAVLGASYRMVADLADPHAALWSMDVSGSSGHPGSPHYDDRTEAWFAGRFHPLPLDGSARYERSLMLSPRATFTQALQTCYFMKNS